MRFIISFALIAFAIAFVQPAARADRPATSAAVKLLPDRIDSFVASSAARPAKNFHQGIFNETGEASRDYVSASGERFSINVVTTTSDSSAFALLTSAVSSYRKSVADSQVSTSETVGTASYSFPDSLFFYKGSVYGVVARTKSNRQGDAPLEPLARSLADLLDKGEGEIPALVKHLPDNPNPNSALRYAVNAETLAAILPEQTVLQTVEFQGGTEVVSASYGQSQLMIAEFTTPQFAHDNDWNIIVKTRELWSQGKPSPTAYRRVGNYSVFVFNAPNEQVANQLIDQVKYEQVVQWLGDNPNWLKDAQRKYTETTLAVFVNVVKASGLAAVICFGVGGLVGGLLFARRRAQQSTAEAYTDAGGMMRLNIDQLSAEIKMLDKP